MSRQIRRIASHYIYLPNCQLLRWGVVTVDSSGQIIDIDSAADIDSKAGVEFYSGILIPGMTNAHTHLELSYMKGKIVEGSGFTSFASQMRIARRGATADDMVRAASYIDSKMYCDGVSIVADICNSDITTDIKRNSKILYHSFFESYGLGGNNCRSLIELRQRSVQMGLESSVTPHSTYSLSDEAFRDAINADPSAPLSIHFMESKDEVDLYKGKGVMKQWYDQQGLDHSFATKYEDSTARIIENISGDRKVLLVHNTFIEKDDILRLKAHFKDNLTFVICPRSNLYITGKLPSDELLNSGVRICLGTDSLASNHTISLIDEMRALPDVPLTRLLQWATYNGADAVGRSSSVGALSVGAKPGIVLLSGVDLDNMALTPASYTKRLV